MGIKDDAVDQLLLKRGRGDERGLGYSIGALKVSSNFYGFRDVVKQTADALPTRYQIDQ